jgi:hypothetical protein
MATNNSANDTDGQNITLMNQRVTAYGQQTPTDANGLNDRALGMLASNNQILNIRGTRQSP